MTSTAHDLNDCTIAIAAMTSWGEAGNWLSAQSLAATIASRAPGANVTVRAADELIPAFADVGRAIKAATLDSGGPRERYDRYAAVLHRLGERFPAGFENRPRGPQAADLEPLAAWIRSTRPDVLIATKGVICRGLLAATRLAGIRAPVINYVTNHAHFAFPVHRCPGAAMHLVRIPVAKRFLEDNCGFDPATVEVVGYLVAAAPLLGDARALTPRASASVIIVSNRGGDEYLTLLRRLAPTARKLELTFVALNDERLRRAANAIAEDVEAHSWKLVTRLDQPDLFRLMHQAHSSPVCALVCKASPNSIFEAAYFRLPMFLLRTGLPMEEWGVDLVVEEGLGVVFDDMSLLASELLAHLEDQEAIAAIQTRLKAFADRYLDQERTIEQVLQKVRHVAVSAGARTQ